MYFKYQKYTKKPAPVNHQLFNYFINIRLLLTHQWINAAVASQGGSKGHNINTWFYTHVLFS